MKTKPRTAPQRGFHFDYLMWIFTRLSALAMYLLVIVGVTAALLMSARQNMTVADLMRWAFMPNPNHVINTNIPDIETWKGIFWQVMGILMLFFAGAHGLHGLLNVLEDYISRTGVRNFLRILVLLIWVLMSAIGTYVILTS
jgi:succinate dehydrogenase / fumarate reductase membrane anchor subunit